MRGFTLIELLISVGIFVFMTALVVAKYGNFNQSVLFTDLAYNAALTLRTAQTYGVGVQGQSGGSNTSFSYPYGVDFCAGRPAGGSSAPYVVTTCSSTGNINNQLVLFADANSITGGLYGNGIYDALDQQVTLYTLTRGALVSGVCASNTGNCSPDPSTTHWLDVSFRRPDPSAIICLDGVCPATPYSYAQVTIRGTDGSLRFVNINQNGQIYVSQ